jgi:hypothetical protein
MHVPRRSRTLIVRIGIGSLLAAALPVGLLAGPRPAGAARPPLHGLVGSHIRSHYVVINGAIAINAVSCSPSGYCMVGGEAKGASSDYGFVATIRDGAIGKFTAVPGLTLVAAMSCPQTGWCLAYGLAFAGKTTENDVSTIINGVPAKAPSNFGTNLPMRALGCESATNCFVVGSINSNGIIVPIVKGAYGKVKAKQYTGPLWSAISCTPNVASCLVIGSNTDTAKPRLPYIARINATSMSAASAISGINAPLGIDCAFQYNCIVSGVNATSKVGETEDLQHVTVSNVKSAIVPFMFNVTCLDLDLCAALALNRGGALGIVPIKNEFPGSFVQAMPIITHGSQSLIGIACQNSAHCYAVGSDTVNGTVRGVLYRFTL